MTLRISNRDARRLWLHNMGLATAPTGAVSPARLVQIIRDLGFVQMDTIRVVARAHDHILWSRNQHYREQMLHQLLFHERVVFEHFTHDASILPVDFYPFWRRQFARMEEKLRSSAWMGVLPPAAERRKIRQRIEGEGALCTRDFTGKADKSRHAWARPPHKYALDYMWHAGDLATCHRRNFVKYYDLAERVIPAAHFTDQRDTDEQINWLNHAALKRLGFASHGDLMRFWDAVDLSEVKAWTEANSEAWCEVEIETADRGCLAAIAPADIEARLRELPAAASRLRIISPFGPAVRDRDRLARLFGFDYRIEIFVPAAKRQYGYYVYPLLEGESFVGRIEVRADRKKGTLTVENLWLEPRFSLTAARQRKLDAELERMARFIGVQDIIWHPEAVTR